MLNLIQHLLPRAKAWRIIVDKTLRRFFEGLAGFFGEVREFIDLVYLDLFPPSTRELSEWERQFALSTQGDEATRRLRLAAAWAAQGGQSPDYIQTQIQAAGFTTIFIHEWWASAGPFVARDPRDYTDQPLTGFYQCEGSDPWECFDPDPGEELAPHCDDSLANEPGYIVNLDLTRRAPPPVPDDPDRWPYFLYFGAETFPFRALVDADRIEELKELILKLKPTQQWIVTLFDPIPALASLLYRFALEDETEYEAGTEDDLRRVETTPNPGTLGGDTVQATSAERPTATTLPEGRVTYFDGAQSVASDLAASTWNALHSPTGVITVAFRFRAIDASGSHSLINTSGPTITNPGIDISYISGVLAWQVGKGGGLSEDLIAFPGDTNTHTVVIVKDGATVSLYVDDMSSGNSDTFAGLSASNATSPLTLGEMVTTSNAWLPEVLIYDFAATLAQREQIAGHLSQWEIAPSQAEYIQHMTTDGLAHFFDGDDLAPFGASTWTDTITGTDMDVGLTGGSRGETTLDGHAALIITSAEGSFHAAAAIADGTNKAFTVFCYAEIPVTVGDILWGFENSTPGDEQLWILPAGSQRVIRNATTSASLSTSAADRFYTHVFRAANDTGANLVRRNPTSETAPALNDADLDVNEFRIRAGANGATYAFVVLYDRALNEGDLQALYQMIGRSL